VSRSPGPNGFADGAAPLFGSVGLLRTRPDPCTESDDLHVRIGDARRFGEIGPVAKPFPDSPVVDDPTGLIYPDARELGEFVLAGSVQVDP
jgi:hypothetical protein